MTLKRRILLKSSAAAAVTLAMPHVARANATRVRIAHAASEVHPAQVLATSFAETLEELMPGAFDVQIFPNRQLGGDRDLLESAVAGTMDIAVASGVLVPLVTGREGMNAWQLPFLVRDYDHFGELAQSAAGQAILDDLDAAGLKALAIADTGQRHFLSVPRAVTQLDDFAGLKTRIVPVPLHQAVWAAVGTAPVGLPYGEVYGALETGVIDAVEINISSMLGENLWEAGRNFTLTGHYPWHMASLASQRFWDSLTQEQQAAAVEAGRRSVQATLDYAKIQDLEGREVLAANGVEIAELADLAVMQAQVATLTSEWAARDPLIADFVAQATQAT
ncbi:MAG: TRAP transporter substrate-binding protein [Pseudomonadota bacterium]